ncbi:flagellar hook-associated protein FlgK [Pseudotabrizicola sp. L79]|uniref:flagellar hook-associated protein FlgK n=1 Tax=Pseudotabrizicola sp. L79 TaxID=3118402 RepID=UPI002F9268D3
MGISSALNNAFSGLSAGARLAEVASGNISNALTEGYAKREAVVTGRMVGGIGMGVQIVSVERQVDKALVQDLRLAGANNVFQDTQAKFAAKLETAYGDPTTSTSLSARLASFERAVVEAAARPDSDARLQSVVDTANQFATGLKTASETVATARQDADSAIARDVGFLNTTLKSVQELNAQITRMATRKEDTSAAMDQRQKLIDQIGEIIPLREVARDNLQVTLFSTTGVTLLDGRPAQFGFSSTTPITPTMTLATGALSGLTIDGKVVSASPNGGKLGQGRLAAQFELRDQTTVDAQNQLDALARDLIERTAGPGVDPTLATGEAGLFVDSLGPMAPLDEAGLAARISVNPTLTQSSGASLWRLRDGMNAATQSAIFDPTLLQSIATRLTEDRPAAASQFSAAGSFAEILADAGSQAATARLSAETAASFSAARTETLKTELLKNGVDTDDEMQDLMLIEQAYAANARVIQTVDDMLRTLLEI